MNKKILAVCGSTRTNSTNLSFIKAISELCKKDLEFVMYSELSDLPHFNPDLDTNMPPEKVERFRNQLKASDGILICTPEYAMGVPGTLKNAIDWTVSSCEFSHKPVALITASTSGEKAHESLLAILNVIEAKMMPQTQLLISYAKTKINDKNEITDIETLQSIQELISAFKQMLEV